MELHLHIIGVLLTVLAVVHIGFPTYFKWKTELKHLSLINLEMMYVHTFFVALIVLLMGLLCITSAHELITTPLGNKIVLGLCVFWTTRLFIQFFGYSSALWKGKLFETSMHILFSVLWAYVSVVFFITYWQF
ncbi:MAG: hypothetical protein ABL940_02600 [Bacteroidia bacterium]